MRSFCPSGRRHGWKLHRPCSRSANTVTWYNTTNAFQQLNNSGQYYHLIALLDAAG